jgi:hypothetical protein
MSRLKDGKPRRYRDHRRLEAKPYNRAYSDLVGRYPPQDRLACRLVGLVADLLVDYERLARSRKVTARTTSAKRKTAGLILGGLRVVATGTNGHGGDDLSAALADLHRDGDGRG